jgi:hypothetical protein
MQSPFYPRAIGVSSNQICYGVESLTLHDDPIARIRPFFGVPGLRLPREAADRFLLVMICPPPAEIGVS